MGRRQRVLINGFGRIGRTILRAWLQSRGSGGNRWPGVEIVAVNDIAAPDLAAHLFAYDSIFGPWPEPVRYANGYLAAGDFRLPLDRRAEIATSDLSGIDLVMECTGHATDRAQPERTLAAGARRVLVSGPCPEADASIVLGANDALLTPSLRVISNASCTTNALAPLARLIDARFGLETGWMTTIHCYTASQPTIDTARGDPARSRAAALSMVPTTTSASRLLDIVLPDLAGRISAAAVRVPVASVSAIDLTARVRTSVSAAEINAALREAGGVIGCTELPLVSSDLRARRESVVMALPETRVTQGGLVRVFGWYDNEWGFSNRMLDVAQRLHDLDV